MAGLRPMAVPMDKRLIGERRVNKMFDIAAGKDRRKTTQPRRAMAVRTLRP
jgi:hypothetical protein